MSSPGYYTSVVLPDVRRADGIRAIRQMQGPPDGCQKMCLHFFVAGFYECLQLAAHRYESCLSLDTCIPQNDSLMSAEAFL